MILGRYINYTRYLLRHKYYVLIECWKRKMFIRGIMHDMSKFRPSEFFPYARHFYNPDGSSKPDENDPDFDRAWLLHQKRNPHHWQYWILIQDNGKAYNLAIPDGPLIEMICDWIGAGKALGKFSPPDDPLKETREWFNQNQENIHIRVNEKAWLIHYFFRLGEVK